MTQGDFYEWKASHSDTYALNMVNWDFRAPPEAAVVEVQGHADGDVKARLEELARPMGLLPPQYEHGATVDITDPRILSWNPWQHYIGRPEEMPHGWYPGAAGRTRVWREFYALGEQTWLLGIIPTGRQPAKSNRTWLDCCGVTWQYRQVGDFETRVVLKVDGWRQSAEDRQSAARYLEMAHQLAARLSEWLNSIPAPEAARQARERLAGQA